MVDTERDQWIQNGEEEGMARMCKALLHCNYESSWFDQLWHGSICSEIPRSAPDFRQYAGQRMPTRTARQSEQLVASATVLVPQSPSEKLYIVTTSLSEQKKKAAVPYDLLPRSNLSFLDNVRFCCRYRRYSNSKVTLDANAMLV